MFLDVDDFKMICCVRNPAWIMDSFETIYRKNPFDYSRMFNAASRQTVYSRCESLINAGGAVGSAWTALKEAYYGEHADSLLIVGLAPVAEELFFRGVLLRRKFFDAQGVFVREERFLEDGSRI